MGDTIGMSHKPPITDEQLAALPPEIQTLIRAIIDHYEARIAELEAKLGKTPQNSSRPPSTQHPHAKPALKKAKRKRKRGGQPGHRKHERALLPVEKCDDVQQHKPTACRRCGEKLRGSDPQPLRHQVWELPEIRPSVTEHQQHRLTCRCGTITCAALPAGVPHGQSGPRLIALTSLLMAYYRQSKRRTAEFLTTLLGVPCCPALTVKMQRQMTAAVRESYEELAAQLPTQTHVSADETPHKEAQRKTWLWTFVAKSFSLFAVRNSREATAIDELLTDQFRGVVSCDRAKMYWRAGRLQWCWAHLIRDFQALIDRGDGQTKRLGYDLRSAAGELFGHWRDYRDGTISRPALQRRLAPVRRAVERYLLRGVQSGNKLLMGMCQELYEHRAWLWEFVRSAGVEPTNNASERALRQAVIWRKLSFGTQSAAGSRFVESMLTVIETCRQQSRQVFGYLTAAIQAQLADQPAPSLLPGP
jgi:transposase